MDTNTETIYLKKKKGWFREYGEAILVAFLIAFVIRSFVFEAFKIPSGSMIPTLMIGDHIFVNKFIYGLRIPLTKKRLIEFRQPKRGEAIVFMFPLDESKDFIKRVVGLPGDTISIHDEEIRINGEIIARKVVQVTPENSEHLKVLPDAVARESGVHEISKFFGWEDYSFYFEQLEDVNHLIQWDSYPSLGQNEYVVPQGHLFVMGDNRDNSADSREWGFVPLENVKGKAMFVWLSLNYDEVAQGPSHFKKWVRWDRFGRWIR